MEGVSAWLVREKTCFGKSSRARVTMSTRARVMVLTSLALNSMVSGGTRAEALRADGGLRREGGILEGCLCGGKQ